MVRMTWWGSVALNLTPPPEEWKAGWLVEERAAELRITLPVRISESKGPTRVSCNWRRVMWGGELTRDGLNLV